jgi:cytochrome P450
MREGDEQRAQHYRRAGVETTAGTLVAFVLAMVTQPDAQRKAQEELDRVVGKERSPTWDDEANVS